MMNIGLVSMGKHRAAKIYNRCSAPILVLTHFVIFLTVVFSSFAQQSQGSEDGPIYFNAATEKYIQGDIDAAIFNVQKAIALEPDNRKYMDFASKILYESALEAYNTRNYKRAYDMLEKAIRYSPSDDKIQNLYKITKEIMSKKTDSSDRQGEDFPKNKEKPLTQAQSQTAKDTRPTYVTKPLIIQKDPKVDYLLLEEVKYLKKWILYLISLCAFIFLMEFIQGIGVFIMMKKIKRHQASIKEKDKIIAELEEQISALKIETEKLREALKYEKENSLRLAKELKEEKNIKNEHFKEQLRLGLDIRQKQLEEMVKSMGAMRINVAGISGEMHPTIFTSTDVGKPDTTLTPDIYTGRARILESIGDATYIDENSGTALEAVRDRIAEQAKELNELSSSAAINFLKEMATNSNPLIRVNILKALSRLPSKWSVDMLISIARTDPVIKVRREAIREIKYLKNAIECGEMTLEEPVVQKIKDFIESMIAEAEWIF